MKGGPNGPDGPERQTLATSPTPIVHSIPDPPITSEHGNTMFGEQGAAGSPSMHLGRVTPSGTESGGAGAPNAQGQRRGLL